MAKCLVVRLIHKILLGGVLPPTASLTFLRCATLAALAARADPGPVFS